MLPSEIGRFPRYAFGLLTQRTAEQLLGDAGLEPASLGLTQWNRLNAWLGHAALDTTGRTVANLTVALTIYAGVDNLTRLARGRVLARTWADGSLQRSLYARGSLLRDGGEAINTRALPIPKPVQAAGINAFDLSVGLDRSEVLPNWSVEIALFHKTLGQIGHPVHVSRPFFNPNRSLDPLTDALARFTGGDLLGDYLRDRSGSWKQSDLSPLEAGLVWLLPLLNIRAAPLLIERKAETLREGKIERGSADIIAYDMEVGLVAIDATRRLPDAHKRDQLLNTVHNLRAILAREDVPITPLIVCSDRIQETRPQLVELGVAVVDGDDLETIHQLARSGNQVASRAYFLHLLKYTQTADAL